MPNEDLPIGSAAPATKPLPDPMPEPRPATEQVVAMARIPRSPRGEARVALQLTAAATVFAEKGYDATTMTEIAAQAGASIGSLYQFFPTKELLATALHERLLANLREALDHLATESAGHALPALADQLSDRLGAFLAEHPAFTTLAERRPVDKARKQAARAAMRDQIATLLTGATPPPSPERARLMAMVILQHIRGTVTLNATEEEPLRSAALAEHRRMLRAYLTDMG